MITISIRICLILLTSHLIHGKVITIDTSNGNNSTECCVEGNCTCASLSFALLSMSNDTIVNIVSQTVLLESTITIGSGSNLNNISINGRNTVIMCNGSGSLYCDLCSSVTIRGITWDNCGNLSGNNTAGLTFHHVSNLLLMNNTFLYLKSSGVLLLEPFGNFTAEHCTFLFYKKSMSNALSIKTLSLKQSNDLYIHISDSVFSRINSNVTTSQNGNARAVSIISSYGNVELYLTNISFISNDNGAVHIKINSSNVSDSFYLVVQGCNFIDNKSYGHSAALSINTGISDSPEVHISNSEFINNTAGDSIVSVFTTSSARIMITETIFTNNVASCMYIPGCKLFLSKRVTFENNTSDNGAAMYLNRGATVYITDETFVQFSNNKALQNGGAIYVDIIFSCDTPVFLISISQNYKALFINNSAEVAGNALFFSIPKACEVNTNINDYNSILHTPCRFNYTQPVNDTILDIPCDFDYTKLNGTGSPIATTPRQLKLYFPYNIGFNISPDAYFVQNNILGYPVMFSGAVFDYFGKPTEPTQFNVQCLDCFAHSLLKEYHLLIDNVTTLSVIFKGDEIKTGSKNITIKLKSLFYSLQEINVTLKVELLRCMTYPGKAYSEEQKICICYEHNVNCYDGYNEIKRGYWFGSVSTRATTSLCPNHYCEFINRRETSNSYFELPTTIDDQCNHHRMGTACGECVKGYTLAYDAPDCINMNQCSAGMTVLVIVLTILYWIGMVAGVFSLMYFNFQISSGYVYGIIYFYSIVGVLLKSNPYISDGAFQFVSVLSSFAQLSPQFLGELCFVKDLSGIDQLFIHYIHPVGVSLLLLFIILAARCSARITLFISRCIIRVICLLLLLAYTSLASISLQLLRPLGFTDVKEVYTYSSPHIQYFHGRHAFYGIVAVICELIVIGLPVFILLEPCLSRKMNFIKIKPILDQFQGCYKDKYRWFSAYYLICRQIIFLIVYVLNDNFYTTLFYLQTAGIVIAMIHIWAQPYKSELLNSLDGVTLLVMVLIISINVFPFLQNVTTGFSIFLVIFPLFLYSLTAIRKVVISCFKSKDYHHVINVENDERMDRDDMGYVVGNN